MEHELDWGIKLTRTDNGYVAEWGIKLDDKVVATKRVVFEETDDTSLDATENLLWFLLDFFNKGGSKHDKERLTIIREPGESYEPHLPSQKEVEKKK